jgi:enamine deaminase RidA (YjgF/YER057c/UK114 family)
MTRKIPPTDKLPTPVGPLSAALHAGEYAYLSGQLARDPATGRLSARAPSRG